MSDPAVVLTQRLISAIEAVVPDAVDVDPVVRPSDRADFQANGVMGLAKRMGANPREVAQRVVDAVDLEGIATVEIAGPGFLNLTLDDAFLGRTTAELIADDDLGLTSPEGHQRVVIDYSAPNVAKEMHVGHLRSTVIGDALVRILEARGDTVLRQNHVGDWGTPFGMLIEHLIDLGEEGAIAELALGDLNDFYREARVSFDGSEAFADRARARVVALQAGDPETLRLWQILVDLSADYFQSVYDRLGVRLTVDDLAGESIYNNLLADVVTDLDAAGLLVTSDGARCVFPSGFTNREGEPLPLIVQKGEGGYGYATTDLAAIRYRIDQLEGDRLLYVVGTTQAEHLAMVFAVARDAGWLTDATEVDHVGFGSVLGDDNKVMKSRSGESLKLSDLLDEAVDRAAAIIDGKNPDLDAAERSEVARMVGIGAIKYADLSSDRTRDYVFSFDRMLAFEGNTSPYLQYVVARVRSILRKARAEGVPVPGEDGLDLPTVIGVGEPAERALALALVAFGGVVADTAQTAQPHRLCTYLFDLAQSFTRFYEAAPILKAPSDAQRRDRLALAIATEAVMVRGLDLLGIERAPADVGVVDRDTPDDGGTPATTGPSAHTSDGGHDAEPSRAGLGGAALAVSLWGGGNVLVAAAPIEGLSLAFLRLWLAVVLYGLIMYARGIRLRRHQLRTVLMGGFFFGADVITFYLALQHTSVAIAVTLQALQPIGVLAAAAVFFGERVTRTHLAWGTLAIGGVLMVVFGAGSGGDATLIGNIWAVLALICWAGYFIGSKSARRHVDNHTYLVWINLIGAVMLTPVIAIVGLNTDQAISWSGLGWVALIVAVPGSGHVIINWAHRHTTLTSSSLLTLAMPVLSTVLAALFLNQSVVPIQIVGIAVTLGALAAVTAYNARTQELIEDVIDWIDPEVL